MATIGKRSSPSHTHTRFVLNIKRVKLLINLDKQHSGDTKYRDILRAAVVLLHASLEDAIRNLIREALPAANEKLWEKITFLGDDGVNPQPAI
jgi:hypothetical protein